MSKAKANGKTGLMERLDKDAAICAEGYLFECERRGYLQAGAFVPEVVLDHPEVVTELHKEFVHAGSDIVEAFTYYGHREKLRIIGKEHLLEPMNRNALEIAKKVADESGTLLAGNLSNTNLYVPGDETSKKEVRKIFDEQVAWAMEYGVDLFVAETFSYAEEALISLEAMRASGVPTVVTLSVHQEAKTRDGYSIGEAMKKFEAAGADVVGLNCARGPSTMLPLLKEARAAVKCHIAALPVPYRTTPEQPTMQSLRDPKSNIRPFPTALDPYVCTRYELGDFTRAAHDLGVRYLGVCCGAGPHHIRAVAEALGRKPEASKYSPDMSKHAFMGTDPTLKQTNREFAERL
ncbi:MAG: homocysteine S-methyltransferase family protein [Candidatus Dormibacteraeota bacterium]|nr:homocysteine S-methyltransferase family protein [Candidatus Dormibacteraeota bacterium]